MRMSLRFDARISLLLGAFSFGCFGGDVVLGCGDCVIDWRIG